MARSISTWQSNTVYRRDEPAHGKSPTSSTLHVENERNLVNYNKYEIGTRCWIYSMSYEEWMFGQVISKSTTIHGETVTVRYHGGEHFKQKSLLANSKYLKLFLDNDFDKVPVYCICKAKMLSLSGRDCYLQSEKAKKESKEEKEKNEKKEESKMGSKKDSYTIDWGTSMAAVPKEAIIDDNKIVVSCDICGCDIRAIDKCYHCPNGQMPVHDHGYDLCHKCGLKKNDLLVEDIYETRKNMNDKMIASNGNDNNSEDSKDRDDGMTAVQLGTKPFAKGGTRYAYLGRYRGGPKKGKGCVIKKYMDKHVMACAGYDGDIKCCELASELVNEWNKLDLVDKKYEMVVPTIARKDTTGWELMLMLNLLLGRDDEMKKMLEEFEKSHETSDEVAYGEVVIIEDYLPGSFVKWNSNSGWHKTFDVSVQAFCHWTYHISNGKHLFCDAQGIRTPSKYILTDPCILSNTKEGGMYGVADVGREYLLNWFLNHKCNEYCDPMWLKPSMNEIRSVSIQVRKQTTTNTVYRKKDKDGKMTVTSIADTMIIKNNGNGNKIDEDSKTEVEAWENTMVVGKQKTKEEPSLLLGRSVKSNESNETSSVGSSILKNSSYRNRGMDVRSQTVSNSNVAISSPLDMDMEIGQTVIQKTVSKLNDNINSSNHEDLNAESWEADNELGATIVQRTVIRNNKGQKFAATPNVYYNRSQRGGSSFLETTQVLNDNPYSMTVTSNSIRNSNNNNNIFGGGNRELISQFAKHLNYQRGEKIVKIGEVDRVFFYKYSTRVMILSSHSRIVLIKPTETTTKEFITKESIEKVEIIDDTRFRIVLTDNNITFRIRGLEISPTQWKQAIDAEFNLI